MEEKIREEVWQKMEKIISYDEQNDLLMVHNGYNANEKFDGCIDMGSIVLDVSSKGRIKGIEFLGATNILSDYKITKKNLMNLKDVSFSAVGTKQGVVLKIKFVLDKKEVPTLISMPLQS